MTEIIPEPSRQEQVARLAAEAALAALPDYAAQLLALQEQLAALQEQLTAGRPAADLREQLTELQEQVAADRQAYASPTRLLANFSQQLTDLQEKHEAERLARIAADAELREQLLADLKLALMERGN